MHPTYGANVRPPLIVGCFLLFLFFIVFLLYAILIPRSFSVKESAFRIEEGESAEVVAMRLNEAEIIHFPSLFTLYARIRGRARSIQAGSYTVRPNMSIHRLLGVFTSRSSQNEIEITLIEGWTAKDIARYLEQRGLFSEEDFLDALNDDFVDEFQFLADIPRTVNESFDSPRFYVQGFLFPDTYRIFPSATPEDVIRKTLRNFDAKFTAAMREEAARQQKTLHEIITMASIIEREVRTAEDKAQVSAVLWRRLELGIALQADATIVFAKTGGYGTLGGDQKLYTEDLKIKSAYNTYINPGLPPGPISNPGINSIEAALYPKKSPYLYYLSAPDGTTIYSKTLEEHNENKARHLR